MAEDAFPQLQSRAYPSQDLLSQEVFSQDYYFLGEKEQHALTFQRARAIAQKYALILQDLLQLKPKFWLLHRDLIMAKDAAVYSIITGQFNLAGGTLAPFVRDRPELVPLMRRILNFDIGAQYLLTEVGHGLDASNLETTATLLENGEFELHSPTADAGKWMPITTPEGGFERVGIVFARLIVEEEDRGVRPFIVYLNDGRNMCQGITAKLIPTRAGSKPANHALTMFDHVRLPSTALLGSLEKPKDMKASFFATIWRVGIGVLQLSFGNISALKTGAYIAGTYSLRRLIGGPDGTRMSIIQFRTQQTPIMHALAEIAVMEAYADEVIGRFLVEKKQKVQHALATCFKAAVGYATQTRLFQLADRCGAQGLFKHNQIIEMQLEARAANIAEGDVLVLCIRLASELLIGRYAMPKPRDPTCLLAQREAGLFREAQIFLAEAGGNHRSDKFNRLVLPLCQPLVEAIGHRMAYEAAVEAKVHPDLIGLYEAGVMMLDKSWYVENVGMKRADILRKEDIHITNLLPHLERLLEETGAAPYATAPILSQERWDDFVDKMETYKGEDAVGQQRLYEKGAANGLQTPIGTP